MKQVIRSSLIIGGAIALAAARPHAAPNPWTIVVGNGPFAGSYKAKADEVICLHSKQQKMYAALFRDSEAKGARALGEGGIKVDDPDSPGPKKGDLHVAFGDDAKRSATYDVYGVPITFKMKGERAEIAGKGKTKEGISLEITASCTDVTTM